MRRTGAPNSISARLHSPSTRRVGDRRSGSWILVTEGQSDEGIDVISRIGHADIHARMELPVVTQAIGKTDIHSANPRRVALVADRDDKLQLIAQLAFQIIHEYYVCDAFRVVIGIC